MSLLTDRLLQLRQDNPDIALVLDSYEDISRAYDEILEALGGKSESASETMNSANVTLVFRPTESSG